MRAEVMNSLDYWENIYINNEIKHIKIDDWLNPFHAIIDACNTKILDLGCGIGNDTSYLLQQGKTVIPCDQSIHALEILQRNFPEIEETRCFNLLDGLPFDDDTFEVIIADLSLHYFRENDTFRILDDINNKLKKDGHLFLRVNTIKDVNHGFGHGKEIEPHVYETKEGMIKRFFDENDIKYFFSKFTIEYCEEKLMTRYSSDKIAYCVSVRKR